jgi:hypothetical protein
VASSIVQVAPDSTGKKIATDQLVDGANTVEIQRVVLADDTTILARTRIKNSSAVPSDYGPVVHVAPDGQQTMANSLPVVIASNQSVLGTGGEVAHDAADSGNPVKMGGKALTNTVVPTAVSATGDRVNAWFDMNGAQISRTGIRSTYTANYRLTARPYALLFAIGANTVKQYATIYHTAGSTKTVRIKKVALWVKNNSVAAVLMTELRRLSSATAPATGNPVITPSPHLPGFTAAEATCLALPTTAGSEAAAAQGWGTQELSLGVTGAASVINPPQMLHALRIVLWDSLAEGEAEDLIMRAGNAEGYAVMIDSSAASTVTATVEIIFTEE